MPRKLIIGLHGLSNKPPEELLREWWWKSITDGLYFRSGWSGFPLQGDREKLLAPDDFMLVYWADIMYQHPSYVHTSTQPYVKVTEPPPAYRPKRLDRPRKRFSEAFTILGDRLRQLLPVALHDRLVNAFLREKFQDLHAYWNKRVNKKFKYWQDDEWHEEWRSITAHQMRNTLRWALQANLPNDGTDVLVIAHSMGSIIAYDVIADPALFALIGARETTLITIGSPLGIPTVRAHLLQHVREGRPIYPALHLKAWDNFADPGDFVAAVPYLSPHFKTTQGETPIRDHLIHNDFKDRDGDSNAHKSFGYLRAPEVTTAIARFLGDGQATPT